MRPWTRRKRPELSWANRSGLLATSECSSKMTELRRCRIQTFFYHSCCSAPSPKPPLEGGVSQQPDPRESPGPAQEGAPKSLPNPHTQAADLDTLVRKGQERHAKLRLQPKQHFQRQEENSHACPSRVSECQPRAACSDLP